MDVVAYEVIWDGAHRGVDADFLVAARVPLKVEAVVGSYPSHPQRHVPPGSTPIRARIHALLARRTWWTTNELAAALDGRVRTIAAVMATAGPEWVRRLRPRDGTAGRPEFEYALAARARKSQTTP